MFVSLTNANREVLEKCDVCHVSILICQRVTYLMNFTLCEIDGSWKEERASGGSQGLWSRC